MTRPIVGAVRAGVRHMGSQAALVLLLAASAGAADEIQYRLTFPEPEHHWMQVEATFPDVPDGTLQLIMSRSSPGRYAIHEFAKNVYDLAVTDSANHPLPVTHPTTNEWDVATSTGAVNLRYRVYGDRVDGTYAAIDTTHAHLNLPAVLIWARGFELRPARLTFVEPAGASWLVATQLYPTGDQLVYTAPNLQYMMDSPTEFGPVMWRIVETTPPRAGSGLPSTIRIALHHTGSGEQADTFAEGVKKIVDQARLVFGEFPEYEPATYTFLADYLPWASGDGMEHRNSTVLTSRSSLENNMTDLLATVAHEYFHCWNVERIRPQSLEPFNFESANPSSELWLAEGVTSFYDGLLMARAGLFSLEKFADDLSGTVETVMTSPATRFRSAEDMSRLAPFVDAASWIDRTNWGNTFISYYTFGAAIGLGFDLAIREQTNGRVTLDDFMRAMWKTHGRPGSQRPGYVDHPYTADDVKARLAEVTGDRAFADQLVSRYVEGHEVMDYPHLLQQAGLVVKRRNPGKASLGFVAWGRAGTPLLVSAPARIGSPAYAAGLDQDDVVTRLDGQPVGSEEQLEAVLAKHKPGDDVSMTYKRRDGTEVTRDVMLEADPSVDVVTVESTGGSPTDAQKAFRRAWLTSSVS